MHCQHPPPCPDPPASYLNQLFGEGAPLIFRDLDGGDHPVPLLPPESSASPGQLLWDGGERGHSRPGEQGGGDMQGSVTWGECLLSAGTGAGSSWPAASRGEAAPRGVMASALLTPGSRTGPPSSRTLTSGSSVLYGPAQPPELPARVRGQGDGGDLSPDTPEPQPPAPGPRNPPEARGGVGQGTVEEG